MDTLVYDIEISRNVEDVPGQWDNPEGMGFGSAVVYSYEKDHYYFFLHQQKAVDMLKLLNGNLVIGFNSVRFDSRVCLGNARDLIWANRWTGNHAFGWANYDIMLEYVAAKVGEDEEEVMAWLANPANHQKGIFSLNGLAGGTFNMQKSGHGAHAPILYQKGQYDELLEYNLRDVILTKRLYDHIQTYGYVVDGKGVKQTMPREV